MFANQLKIQLINYFLKSKGKINYIACEVPLLGLDRIADLLVSSSQGTHAFEIKGDRDSLKRLRGQIKDLQKVFDFVSVFTTEKYIDAVLRETHSDVGIYKMTPKGVLCLRKPKKVKEQDLYGLLCFSKKDEIITELSKHGFVVKRTISTFLLRKKVIKLLTERQVKKFAKDILGKKYLKRFQLFMYEKGEKVTLEDILLLQRDVPVRLSIAKKLSGDK